MNSIHPALGWSQPSQDLVSSAVVTWDCHPCHCHPWHCHPRHCHPCHCHPQCLAAFVPLPVIPVRCSGWEREPPAEILFRVLAEGEDILGAGLGEPADTCRAGLFFPSVKFPLGSERRTGRCFPGAQRMLPAFCARECSPDTALTGIWDPFGLSSATAWGTEVPPMPQGTAAPPGAGFQLLGIFFRGCSAAPRHPTHPKVGFCIPPSLPSGWRLPQPGHGSSPRPWEWEVERLYFKPPLWVGDLEKQLREQECEVQPPPLRAGPPSTG